MRLERGDFRAFLSDPPDFLAVGVVRRMGRKVGRGRGERGRNTGDCIVQRAGDSRGEMPRSIEPLILILLSVLGRWLIMANFDPFLYLRKM